MRREQERYAQGGMVGLGRTRGWRRGRRRVSGKRLRSIESLKSQGLSNRAIAQRLGVNEKAIRKLAGPSKDDEVEQLALATISNTPASEPPFRSALSLEELRERAPAAFAIGAHERTSRSYRFISTVGVLNALAEAGFMPVEARQSSQRAASPLHVRHLIRPVRWRSELRWPRQLVGGNLVRLSENWDLQAGDGLTSVQISCGKDGRARKRDSRNAHADIPRHPAPRCVSLCL